MGAAQPWKLTALCLTLLLASVANAASRPENSQLLELRSTVALALAALDNAQQDENWLFTLTLVENDESRIIQHDPRKPPYLQRTLLEVDGAAPDADHLKKFREQEEKRIDERDPEASYTYLVDLDTLESVKKAGELMTVTFSPRLKDMEKVESELEGSLLLNTTTGQIDQIDVYNTATFSPVFSVKIKEFRLTFQFRDEQGTRLLEAMRSHTRGKAGFLKSFDSLVTISFQGFQRIEHAPALLQVQPE